MKIVCIPFGFFLGLFADFLFAYDLEIYVDPFCPYCKQVLANYEHLDSLYDLDIIWAPILGNRSQQYVKQIFRCQDPFSEKVFSSVVAGETECKGVFDAAAWDLNMQKYEKVDPEYVPYMLLDGRKVSWSYLKSRLMGAPISVAGVSNMPQVKLNWSRYSDFMVGKQQGSNENIPPVLLFVKNRLDVGVKQLIERDERYKWFVAVREKNAEKYEELSLLLGVEGIEDDFVLIEGRIETFNSIAE